MQRVISKNQTIDPSNNQTETVIHDDDIFSRIENATFGGVFWIGNVFDRSLWP